MPHCAITNWTATIGWPASTNGAQALLQKEHGPSLVVAPASVVPNWKSEIERFAPSLNVQILNFAQDRKEVIDNAGPGDVVVTTYGILLSVQDLITSKEWNGACLDEAQQLDYDR